MEQEKSIQNISFFEKRAHLILAINLALTFLIGWFLFDTRLSFASDDAAYINNAMAWNQNGSYPHFQGALWPFIISFVMGIVGNKLLTFKMLSLLFCVLGNFALFKALHKRIPAVLMWAGLFTVSLNAYIQAYSSSTFSESLYMMMQAFTLWAFFNACDASKSNSDIKKSILPWLIFGFTFFLLSISKNLAIFSIIAIVIYFIARQEWKLLGLALISILVFKAPYQLIVDSKYPAPAEVQSEMLKRKDYYNPNSEKEDASGYIDRLFTNYGQYVGIHVFKILGVNGKGVTSLFTFEKMEENQESNKMEPNGFYSLIFFGLVVFSLWMAFKSKNGAMLFMILYSGTLMGLTFVALQTFWNQDRLMIIFMPFILPMLLYGIYELGKSKSIKAIDYVVGGIIILFCLTQLKDTSKSISKNNRNFKYYQKGDIYSAYPEPLQTYLKASKWAGENIKDSGFVIVPKPIEVAAFGGLSRFKKMPSGMPNHQDSIFVFFKKNKCGYIMEEQLMGTNQQLIDFFLKNIPNSLTLIHTEEGYAPTKIYKINN